MLQDYILTICQGLRTAIMALTWDPHPRTLPLEPGAISKLKLWSVRPVCGPCCSGLLVGFLAWVLDLWCRQPCAIPGCASWVDLGAMPPALPAAILSELPVTVCYLTLPGAAEGSCHSYCLASAWVQWDHTLAVVSNGHYLCCGLCWLLACPPWNVPALAAPWHYF